MNDSRRLDKSPLSPVGLFALLILVVLLLSIRGCIPEPAHANELQRALASFPAPKDSISIKGWNLRMARVDSLDVGGGWEAGARVGLCRFYLRMSCNSQTYDLDSMNTEQTIPTCSTTMDTWNWPADVALGQFGPGIDLTGWLFEDKQGLATATFSGGYLSDLSVDGVESWLVPGDSLEAVKDQGRPYTLRTVRLWNVGTVRWIQVALGRL